MSIYFTVRDQVFNITVNGLKPNTVHNCYFERKLVDISKIKPKNGQLGNTLITDQNGSVTFDYYYESGVGTQATQLNSAQQTAANLAGVKEIIVTDSTSPSLDVGYEDTASSIFNGRINISVYIPPESEWTDPVVAARSSGGSSVPYLAAMLTTALIPGFGTAWIGAALKKIFRF